MMRLGLAAMAGLLCMLCGLRAASSLRQEAAENRRWAETLAHLALIIGEESVPLPEAFRLAGDGDAPPDKLLQQAADALQNNPYLSLTDIFEQLSASCRARDTLLRLAARLGRGSAENRRLAAEQAAAAFALLADSAEKRVTKDAKLYQTLGWTSGACLMILLM